MASDSSYINSQLKHAVSSRLPLGTGLDCHPIDRRMEKESETTLFICCDLSGLFFFESTLFEPLTLNSGTLANEPKKVIPGRRRYL